MACKNILEIQEIQNNKMTKDFIQYFNSIENDNFDSNNINQWYERYNSLCDWSINLANIKDKHIVDMLYDQKKTVDLKFCNFILNNYKSGVLSIEQLFSTTSLAPVIFWSSCRAVPSMISRTTKELSLISINA